MFERELGNSRGVHAEERVCEDDYRAGLAPACGLERPFEVRWFLDPAETAAAARPGTASDQRTSRSTVWPST